MFAVILILAQGAFPTQSFVIEHMHRTVRWESDGTGRMTLDVRVRIQSAAALQAFGQLQLPYGSAYQRLDVDTVRVHKVGGTTVTAPASAVQDVDAPLARQAPIYSDLRLKIVTVPGLQPGDTLEYHLTWTTHTPIAPGQFWDNSDFVKKAVVLDERLIYDVPRSSSVRVKTEGGGAEPRVAEAGDRRTYEWRRANLVADTATERATSTFMRAKHDGARITTFHSWAEVGAWYGALAHERETVTPAIRQRAEELVAGRTTLLDSIAALYDYVSHRFRYVSLSFGVGRYQPHAAAEVLANEYGDCKDKHVLLAALLSAIGVTSAPVLISSDEPIDPDVPSPGQFDHVITFVLARGDSLWVDATPGVAPFRFLMWGLRNKQALVMPVTGTANLSRTPLEPPFETFAHSEVVGSLSPLDRLQVKVSFITRGDVEVFMRQLFQQVPEDRWPLLAQRVASEEELKGTVSGTSATDPTDTRGPFVFTFQVDVPGAVTWANRGAELALPLPKIEVPKGDSTTPNDSIVLGVIRETVGRLTLVTPTDVTLRLPLPVTVTRDYGTYRSVYERRGDTLIVERVLRFNARLLPPSRGRDLAAFHHAIDDDQDQKVALQRSADPRASVAGAEDVRDVARAASEALDGGDPARALGLLREVVRRDPQNQWAWNALGRAHLQLNQLDSAAAAFRKTVEVNPYDQYAYNNLGLAFMRMGRREDARAAFQKQVEVNPLDRYAHANLGRLLLEMRRDSAAAQALEKAVSITPDDSALYRMLGTAYLHLRRPDDAVAALERGLAIAPSPAAWHNIAAALVEAGVQLDRAEGYARQAVDATAAILRTVHPDSVGIEERLAVATLGSYWDTLGWIYFAKGDVRQAERYVRAAWLMNFQGAVGDHLGQIQMRLGRRADAVHTYALALNAIRPPDATRDRLQRLVGSQQVDRVIETARTEFVTMRTVRLKTPLFADVSGEVQLIFGTGARVESVRVLRGPAAQLETLRDAIRSATYPVALPDTTPVKIVRRGVVTCSTPSGACVLVLFPADQFPMREVAAPPYRR